MPQILIATDIPGDPFAVAHLPRALADLGYEQHVVTPSSRLPEALQLIAASAGQVHAVVILHTGSISSGVSDPWRIVDAVRSLPDKLSIDGVVKAKALPILVINDTFLPDDREALKPSQCWCRTFCPLRSSESIEGELTALLHDWRKDLLAELDCVGYAVTLDDAGQLSVDAAFARPKVEGDILAATATLGRLRSSKYLILSADFLQDSAPYVELAELLNSFRDVAKAKRIKPEEVFQQFFTRNPSLIQRGQFAEHWAKPRLKIPDSPQNYIEPDFVLRPRISAGVGTKWQVLDIKLPDVKLTAGRKFHPGFSAKLMRAVQQLRNYRKYFNRQDTTEELLRQFGYHPRNPQLAVLIGTGPDSDESEIFAEAQGDHSMLDIEIVTYDEILESRKRLLDSHLAWFRSLQ